MSVDGTLVSMPFCIHHLFSRKVPIVLRNLRVAPFQVPIIQNNSASFRNPARRVDELETCEKSCAPDVSILGGSAL